MSPILWKLSVLRWTLALLAALGRHPHHPKPLPPPPPPTYSGGELHSRYC